MTEHDRIEETRGWPYRESPALRPPLEPELARTEPEDELDSVPASAALQQPGPEPEPEPGAQAMPAPVPVPAQPEEQEGEEEGEAEEPAVEEPAAEELAAEHATGELAIPDGCSVLAGSPTGGRRSVAVVVSRFNGEITNRLLQSALEALQEAGVTQDAILVVPVPGAFELPLTALALAKTRRYACVVALGCVIRGETPHFDFVAGEAASGLQLAAIETGVPVAFGLLTCETREQAEARIDRAADAARTALEMADLFAQLRTQAAAAR